MLKRLIFILTVLVSLTTVAQNTFTINGRIIDEKLNAIPGASVRILNSGKGELTDADGKFIIRSISAGKYSLVVSAIDFATDHRNIEVHGNIDTLVIILRDFSTVLDAVTVTAQKREESILQVPISISSLSSRQVEEYRLWDINEITAIVPNLYSADPGDNRNVTSIRGITSTSYDPAVTTYIDGVNQFNLDTYIAQLFDVERIEVLRGPQGTLYGRNAMGGVINIITKQPSNKSNGFAEVSIGNYGKRRYGVGMRVPLINDKLFFGMSELFDRSNGYYKNSFNNKHFDKKSELTGNYYLLYKMNEKLKLTWNLKHHNHRNEGSFPLVSGVTEAFSNPYMVNQDATAKMIDNIFNTSLSIDFSGRRFNFNSQTAWQSNYRYYNAPLDGDFSPIDAVTVINNFGKNRNHVKVFTHEIKFTSPASQTNVQWTAGTYFFHLHNPTKLATRFGRDAGMLGIPDSMFSIINSTTVKNNGMAFYGQAIYSIGSKVDLTAGLRYDYENKKQRILGEYQHDPDPDPVFETRPDTSATANFNAFTPKIGVTYHFSGSSNAYISYTRGYRSGGFTQLSSDPSQPPLFSYKPEYSNNLEVGMKNNFSDRFRADIVAFYTIINDAQVPTLIIPDAITLTRNAGKLESKGMEIEISGTPVKGLQLDYSGGFNRARYKTLRLSQNGGEVNLEGKRQVFTPDVTSMVAIQYRFRFFEKNAISISIRGEWQYIGRQFFDLANTIQQSPYNLINLRLAVTGKNFEIAFWERNVTQRKYIAYAYDFGAVHLGDPQNYGVTIVGRF